jgi:vancomycin resistance protein YoaR
MVTALALACALATPAPAESAPPPAENAFPVVLGSYATTLIGSSPARTQNLRLAVAALDGTVLDPGAVLSFNQAVGPRTADRGFQLAPVILREERQLQLGGGICQAASTLFCAALMAGLSAPERWRHSSPVDYIALGQDATIAWGFKDLKIRNDLEQRVRVRLDVVGATLLARIEGEQPLDAAFDLAVESREVPEASDDHLPGREVELYRVRRVDGQEVDRELVVRDFYPSMRAPETPARRAAP